MQQGYPAEQPLSVVLPLTLFPVIPVICCPVRYGQLEKQTRKLISLTR